MRDIMKHMSPTEVERAYSDGRVTRDEVVEYIKLWNAGPHFCQAILTDNGAIHIFNPEHTGAFYKHLKKEFGLRL